MNLTIDELLEMIFQYWFGDRKVEYDRECMKSIFSMEVSLYRDFHITPSTLRKNLSEQSISTPEELLYALFDTWQSLNDLYKTM